MALSKRMPRLILESRRVAATLSHGIHGRKRAGTGETFWQFRPFVTGESAHRIDWRRSGRDDRLYVREREWEAAQTLWFWIDRSASMGFASDLAQASKIDRALVLTLALAGTFVESGERVGMLGLMPARATRQIAEKMAEVLVADKKGLTGDLPPRAPIPSLDEAVLVSDFLSPVEEVTRSVEAISAKGARGHLIMIVDPVEETFPFSGQAVLHDLEDGISLRVGDAAAWGRAYRERIRQHREALESLARRRRWTMTIHRTDRPASEAALRLLTLVAASRTVEPGGR
jgi:uncharacterized protein (DUF58 family)